MSNLNRNEQSAMNGYRNGSRTLVAGAVLGIALVASACGSNGVAEDLPQNSALVLGPSDLATAESSEIAGGIVLTGTLNPYRIVDVKAQVPGTIARLDVDRGDAVSAGQTLAVIRAEGIQGQAEGAAAAVAAAEAGLALAEQQLESARMLHEAGAMSSLDFRSAQANHEAARAQLAAARAQAAGASEQARNATVSAPFAGEVSNRQANPGEAVNVGQTLFTVVNSTTLELAGQVAVAQATRVSAGAPVRFTIDAYPDRVFSGTVARVEPTADPSTRQVGVYLQLPNQDRSLVGGLFATGRVLIGGGQESIVVPVAAVRGNGADSYVWVVQDGQAVRRPVTAGVRDETAGVIAIDSGLRAGERVVVAPGEFQEGATVRIAGESGGATATVEE